VIDRFEVLAEGLNHPEGVAWSPVDGHVYAGGEGGEFYRVSLRGEVEELGATGGSMLGIAVDGNGRVYACDDGNGEIVRIDPTTRKIETFARGLGGADLDEPNVAAFGPDGSLYVTCSGGDGNPEIVRVRDGVTERWCDQVVDYPNGMAVLPGGDAMLVIESHAQRIARVPIGPDGAAGSATTFAELPDTDADGLALDAEGHVWATLYRPDGLVRFDPDGTEVLRIDDHLATTFDAPTNMVFVGEGLRRAVVANVGDRFLVWADLDVAGAPLHYPEVP
jgi:sugar lactone lactonase YvrE